MHESVTSANARFSLRLLASPQALEFGTRLLQRGEDGVLSFREFLEVAREFVDEEPGRAAVYLAALVALDMGAPGEFDEFDEPDDDDGVRPSLEPSLN